MILLFLPGGFCHIDTWELKDDATLVRRVYLDVIGRLPTPEKVVIFVCLSGGPPHLDMYDPKPEAPLEARGKFRPIAAFLPGLLMCEPLPERVWTLLVWIFPALAQQSRGIVLDTFAQT